MTGKVEILRPLVEACLDIDPVKRPSILELSEKIKPLKVGDMQSAKMKTLYNTKPITSYVGGD